MKGKRILYSPRELAWIKRHRTKPRREAHIGFCNTFRRPDVSLNNFKELCMRKGWTTGRTGCFPKGHAPVNKGQKMPYNANRAATQFKKGGRTGRANQLYKPIGIERVTRDGYIERKIHDGLPMQSRWRAVHLINWEAANGPLLDHHCLKCLDGNRQNTDPSNWALISRAVLTQLNHRTRIVDYDDAPPELKPAILTLAKLKRARFVKTRERRSVTLSQSLRGRPRRRGQR